MKNSLLIFGTKNFNNSLDEIKEYLNFSLVFYEKSSFFQTSLSEIVSVLVDSEVCNDLDISGSMNRIVFDVSSITKNGQLTSRLRSKS